MSEFTSENKLKVYPNPASEYVVFSIDNSQGPYTVELYTLAGKRIIKQQLQDDNQLELSQIKAGLYIYKIIQGARIFQGKLQVN